jgi:hypothetical protein
MKRFLIGTVIGLFIGWITVPLVRAGYSVAKSDHTIINQANNDDLNESHAYKWYLTQILIYMRSMDNTLKALNVNMLAVKEKLHA